jgi:cytochrome P450
MGEREPSFADLKRLKLTRDVFREALRLYPSFGYIARSCAHDEAMRDKSVKAGSTVAVAPWLIHRHRTHWERPDIFDPDRFRTESGKASLRTAYLPFSLGPRVCLGAAFAMQEAVLILACLARRYRFEALAEHVPKPVGRLTIRSENGIKLRLHRR